MAETNGAYVPTSDGADIIPASAADVDALLAGLFEPTSYDIAPGRTVEIRPLLVGGADQLYAGVLKTPGDMQNYLLERCVFFMGRPLGAAGVARLPYKLAADLATACMKVNGMQQADTAAGDDEGAPADPKA